MLPSFVSSIHPTPIIYIPCAVLLHPCTIHCRISGSPETTSRVMKNDEDSGVESDGW